MAAAVETREPLLPLHPHNSQDLGRLSPVLGKLLQSPKLIRKSASIGASKSHFAAKAEPIKPSPFVENFVTRRSPTPTSSPERITEDPKPALEISQLQNRSTEKQGESGITALSTGNDRNGRAMMERDRTKEVAAAGEEQESRSLLQLKMEAMTWAAMAKDYEISSLERRLRQALEIAKAEQDRNQELGRLLRESQEREAAAAVELQDAKEQIGQLIEAEERLCVQLGDLEAEAVEEDRRYRSQIATLAAKIEAQDQSIAAAVLEPSTARQQPRVKQSESFSCTQTGQYESLPENLEMSEIEIATLRAELIDANAEVRVAEGLKKSQARKLKALEKERRYLMRKGAIRLVRLAPRAHKKSDREAPGGEGWKVFSILDFQA